MRENFTQREELPEANRRRSVLLWAVYGVLMAGLLVAFTICDFREQILWANRLKFTSIGVNTVALVWALARGVYAAGCARGRLRAVALFFTLAADVFLILLDTHYLAGVLLFCVVETLYFLSIQRPLKLWIRALIRATVFLAGLAIVAAVGALDVLTGASVSSMVMLRANVVEAIGEAKGLKREETNESSHGSKLQAILFATGLALFWLCDASVGLRNLPSYFPGAAANFLANLAGYAIWWFYLPAQILIFVSGVVTRSKHE